MIKEEIELSPEEQQAQKDKEALYDRLLREHAGKRLREISIDHDDQIFDLVFSVPSMKTFQDIKLHAGEGRESMANEVAIYDCLIHPEKHVVAKLIEDYPALEDRLGGQVSRLAGTSATFKVKKLIKK